MTTSCPIWERVRGSDVSDPIPCTATLRDMLAERIEQVGGKAAFDDFVRAQRRAADLWGPARTAHFGQVLRELRVTRKAAPRDRWARAESAAASLPEPWRTLFRERIAAGRVGSPRRTASILSAAYLKACAQAFRRWLAFCSAHGHDLRPAGTTLEAFAASTMSGDAPASVRSAGDYIERIVAAWRFYDPGFKPMGVELVLTRFREAAKAAGSPTKTGDQLVGAHRIYALGFSLMDRGRGATLRGLHAARHFRNGVLLSVGVALPQRARALSELAYDRTVFLPERGVIDVRLPGAALKHWEGEKALSGFETRFRNIGLWEALVEYRRAFRPLFDEGDWLFPSMLDRAAPISEGQIGKLSGDITERELGVRVPIHRLRDNVATDASEDLSLGARAVPVLLGHSSLATGPRHYDHSQGIGAAEDHASFLDEQRTEPCALRL